MTIETMICTKCGKHKLIENFPVRSDTKKRNRQCRLCVNDRAKKWLTEHLEQNRKYHHEYQKSWWRNHPKHRHSYKAKRRWENAIGNCRLEALSHGYSPCNSTAEEVKKAFTGFCFVCGIPEDSCSRKLCLDHDHKTGSFRGWLCGSCNQSAGLMGDSYKRILQLARYIKKHGS